MKTNKKFLAAIGLGVGMALAALPSAQAALQGRDLDPAKAGFEAYYDTELNISWLADFGAVRSFEADGRLSWDGAQSWIAQLNTQSLYGFNNWRLPKVTPVNGQAFRYGNSNNGSTDYGVAATGQGWGKASEMGHLYYVTLGNKGYCTPTPAGNDACTIQPGWEQTRTSVPSPACRPLCSGLAPKLPNRSNQAWYFYAYYGNQYYQTKDQQYSALAVRDGDVLSQPVPEPTSALLMFGGLLALAAAVRRKSVLR